MIADPWVTKGGHDVSGQPRDEEGKWVAIAGRSLADHTTDEYIRALSAHAMSELGSGRQILHRTAVRNSILTSQNVRLGAGGHLEIYDGKHNGEQLWATPDFNQIAHGLVLPSKLDHTIARSRSEAGQLERAEREAKEEAERAAKAAANASDDVPRDRYHDTNGINEFTLAAAKKIAQSLPSHLDWEIVETDRRGGKKYYAVYTKPEPTVKSLRCPWLVTKGRAGWDEHKHPRDHGQFSSGAGAAGDRHNPDLDAVWNDEPAKTPAKPTGPARHNPDLDAFMAAGDDEPRYPSRHNPDVDYGHADDRDSDDKHIDRLLAEAKQSAAEVVAIKRQIAKLEKRGSKANPKAVENLRGKLKAATEKAQALAAKAAALKDPQRAGRIAGLRGDLAASKERSRQIAAERRAPMPSAAAKPAAAPPAAKPQAAPPATSGKPHERTHAAALQAANAAVQALRSGKGGPAAHKQAIAALDAHLKEGLAELDRRGGSAGSKQRFTAKIQAAKAKLAQIAQNGQGGAQGRQPPPLPSNGRNSPQRTSGSQQRAFGKRQPPPLPRRKAFACPWLVTKAANEEPKEDPRIREIADEWYRPDGSPKTRAMRETMVRATAEKYGCSLEESRVLVECASKVYPRTYKAFAGFDLAVPATDAAWVMKSRDATGHEHAADGRFGATAGSHGGKPDRHSSPSERPGRTPSDRPGHADGSSSKATKLAAKASSVPRQLRAQVHSFVRSRYRKLSKRYGPKGAYAILGAVILLLPAPVPGSSLIPIAVAECVLAIRRAAGLPLDRLVVEVVVCLARRLVRDLYAACGETWTGKGADAWLAKAYIPARPEVVTGCEL